MNDDIAKIYLTSFLSSRHLFLFFCVKRSKNVFSEIVLKALFSEEAQAAKK